jgi:hypothetical protein
LLHTKYSYSFKFENLWLKEEDVEEVVEMGWRKEACDVVTDRVASLVLMSYNVGGGGRE